MDVFRYFVTARPALSRILVSRDETIARLLAKIARLKRWRYGRSPECIGELTDQLQLALDDLPEAAGELVTPVITHDYTRYGRCRLACPGNRAKYAGHGVSWSTS